MQKRAVEYTGLAITINLLFYYPYVHFWQLAFRTTYVLLDEFI
jgi:hypothetical protein